MLTHPAIQQHFAFEMSNNEIPHFSAAFATVFAHLRCHAHFGSTNQKFCVGKMEKLSHVQNLLFYYFFLCLSMSLPLISPTTHTIFMFNSATLALFPDFLPVTFTVPARCIQFVLVTAWRKFY